MKDYASPQPVDRFGNQVRPEQAAAQAPAYQTNVSGALLSSIITLDGRSTILEVTTGAGPAGLAWYGSVIGVNPRPSVTTTTWDNAIPANTIRRFVIPQSVQGVAHVGSIVGGFGSQNGLYTQVAVIPLQAVAPTSIFTSQF